MTTKLYFADTASSILSGDQPAIPAPLDIYGQPLTVTFRISNNNSTNPPTTGWHELKTLSLSQPNSAVRYEAYRIVDDGLGTSLEEEKHMYPAGQQDTSGYQRMGLLRLATPLLAAGSYVNITKGFGIKLLLGENDGRGAFGANQWRFYLWSTRTKTIKKFSIGPVDPPAHFNQTDKNTWRDQQWGNFAAGFELAYLEWIDGEPPEASLYKPVNNIPGFNWHINWGIPNPTLCGWDATNFPNWNGPAQFWTPGPPAKGYEWPPYPGSTPVVYRKRNILEDATPSSEEVTIPFIDIVPADIEDGDVLVVEILTHQFQNAIQMSFRDYVEINRPDTYMEFIDANIIELGNEVRFSPSPEGNYSTTQNVILTAPNAGAIYYTTDGTTPTSSSNQYLAPIAVAQTTTIKAVYDTGGGNLSTVRTVVYTIVTQVSAAITSANAIGSSNRLLATTGYFVTATVNSANAIGSAGSLSALIGAQPFLQLKGANGATFPMYIAGNINVGIKL